MGINGGPALNSLPRGEGGFCLQKPGEEWRAVGCGIGLKNCAEMQVAARIPHPSPPVGGDTEGLGVSYSPGDRHASVRTGLQ